MYREIEHLHKVKRMSQRAIAEELGVTRYYVRKVLDELEGDKEAKTREKLIRLLKTDIRTLRELSKTLNIPESEVDSLLSTLKSGGYLIDELHGGYKLQTTVFSEGNVLEKKWNNEKIIRFGVASDTHLGSKYQQITHLNSFYDLLVSEGIDTVYHPGDITEGVNMRRGHEYEVHAHGADAQKQYVIDHYPKREGMTTYFITGNHDHTSIRHAGHDIGEAIALKRPDLIYLGQANAKVKLTDNCILELNHPLDGAAYALSYAPQKLIDSMSGGEKPNILLNGHHHKAFYMFYRNIHVYEAACFQAQTAWMRGKRLAAHLGGWIIEVHVDDEGTITRCRGELIPYYTAIENDY